MPAYEFRCGECGPFELLGSFSQAREGAYCPECGEPARRVYSMPGVVSISGVQKKARLLNERGAEPKVLKNPANDTAAPKPVRVGGRPWQINH